METSALRNLESIRGSESPEEFETDPICMEDLILSQLSHSATECAAVRRPTNLRGIPRPDVVALPLPLIANLDELQFFDAARLPTDSGCATYWVGKDSGGFARAFGKEG